MQNPSNIDVGVDFLGEASSAVQGMSYIDNSTRTEIGNLLNVISSSLLAPQTANLLAAGEKPRL